MELQQIGAWPLAYQYGPSLTARDAEPIISPDGAAFTGGMRSTVFIEPPCT